MLGGRGGCANKGQCRAREVITPWVTRAEARSGSGVVVGLGREVAELMPVEVRGRSEGDSDKEASPGKGHNGGR